MKIRPVGAELFHAERRTGRHNEADDRSLAMLQTHVRTNQGRGIFRVGSEIHTKHIIHRVGVT